MYKNHKGKWSFFSKKTADMSPFSSWCGRISIPFYNGMQAELVNIRQSEDCALFPLLNLLLSLRKSPGFPLQKCCRCLCVCVWSVWGKDWRGIRWKKDYFSYPPPQFIIKHNNNGITAMLKITLFLKIKNSRLQISQKPHHHKPH